MISLRFSPFNFNIHHPKPAPRYALTVISDHTSAYRGFSITRLKRNKRNPITRYHVRQGNESYGKFDAQAEATKYIDELYEMKG